MFRERQGPGESGLGLPNKSGLAAALKHEPRSSVADLRSVFFVGAAYFALALAGLQLASIHPSATPIWPPTGLAIAAVLLCGYRVAPAIFVAAFLVNQLIAGSTLTSLAIACGNTLEAVTAVYLIRSFMDDGKVFETPSTIAKFFLACLAATTISATVGVGSLTLGGHADAANFLDIWFTWWLGDLAGAVVVAPVLVLWARSNPSLVTPSQIYRTTVTYVVAGAVGLICFSPLLQQTAFREALAFFVVLPLLWASVRSGPRDAATVALIITVCAIWYTWSQGGLFSEPSLNSSYIVLMVFLISIAMPALALSVEVSARRRIEKRQRQHSLEAEVLWQATIQVAAGGSFDELLRACLQHICQVTGWAAGHVYIPDRVNDPHYLRSSAVWHFEHNAIDLLARDTMGVELSRGQGLPGKIWATANPVWMSDISQCDSLPRKKVLLKRGFRAAFGFPIYVEGKLQAVLEFFSTKRQPPDECLMRIVRSIGEQLGRVIERQRSQERQAAFETTLNTLTLAVYFTDGSGRIIYMNQTAREQISNGRGLRFENSQLIPVDRTARPAFATALAAANGARAPTDQTTIPLPEKDDAGLIAVVLPLQGSELKSACGTMTATAAVLVQDSVTVPLSTGKAFAELYGLTKSELRVLLTMTPGLSLKELAEKLGICDTTAKTYLQHIFAKTGTSKQSELVHLLMRFTLPIQHRESPPDANARASWAR